MAEITHWVLGDCVQRALSVGHETACARRIRDITCRACNDEIAKLRTDALDLGPPTDRIATLEAELDAQRAETMRARRQIDELRWKLDVMLLCPKCERRALRARSRGGYGYLACPDAEGCGFFRSDPRKYDRNDLREMTNGELGVTGSEDE